MYVDIDIALVGNSGDKMVVLGTHHGLWVGKESDTNGLKKVIKLNDVTQIDILESHHILLVLAGKIKQQAYNSILTQCVCVDKTLTAYPISQLDPTCSANVINKLTANKKSTEKSVLASRILSNHASYFNTGTCHGKTLVIVMKRKGSDSHFKALEPVCGDLNDAKNAKYLSTKTSFMNKQSPWFKVYKVTRKKD